MNSFLMCYNIVEINATSKFLYVIDCFKPFFSVSSLKSMHRVYMYYIIVEINASAQLF